MFQNLNTPVCGSVQGPRSRVSNIGFLASKLAQHETTHPCGLCIRIWMTSYKTTLGEKLCKFWGSSSRPCQEAYTQFVVMIFTEIMNWHNSGSKQSCLCPLHTMQIVNSKHVLLKGSSLTINIINKYYQVLCIQSNWTFSRSHYLYITVSFPRPAHFRFK